MCPASGTRLINSSAELTERIFKVNLASHFVLIKEFLPGMLEARKGHIVTIASTASFLAAPGLVDYCCTKVGALYLHEGEVPSCYPCTSACLHWMAFIPLAPQPGASPVLKVVDILLSGFTRSPFKTYCKAISPGLLGGSAYMHHKGSPYLQTWSDASSPIILTWLNHYIRPMTYCCHTRFPAF